MKTTLFQESYFDFSIASEIFTEKEYIAHIKTLVQKSISHDPTLILHSDEEIQKKYHSSIVVFDRGLRRMIWNSSIYSTTFACLQELSDSFGRPIKIGETGSSVIDPNYRNYGIGKRLIIEAELQLWRQYDAIIGATVNTIMRDMRIRELWYEIVPFPNDLYEEWKKYLAPRMIGGIKEFEEKATCIMKFFVPSIREQVINALI